MAVRFVLSIAGIFLLSVKLRISLFQSQSCFTLHPFCCQNVVVGAHRVERPTMDSTKTYSHCRAPRDVQLMLRYHDKII